MDEQQVKPSSFEQILDVPNSLFHTVRATLLGCLTPGTTILQNYAERQEFLEIVDLLKTVGLSITQTTETLLVTNSFPACESTQEVHDYVELTINGKNEHYPLLIAFLSRGKKKYRLKILGKKVDYFIGPLYELLKSIHIAIDVIDNQEDFFVLEIKGPPSFHKSVIEVDCTLSTKPLSAVALAYSDLPLKVEPLNYRFSDDNYELLKNMIKSYSFEVANQRFHFFMPVDFEALVYPCALASMRGHVIVSNCLYLDLMCPPSYFLRILEKMGAKWQLSPQGLEVQKDKELIGQSLDLTFCPELIPAFSFLAAYAQTPSTVKGVKSLGKNLEGFLEVLRCFEVVHHLDEKADTLFITGKNSKVSYKEFGAKKNPKTSALAYLFMRVNGGGRLFDIGDMDSFFPHFFPLMDVSL